jgi:hypothetical protein
LIATPKSISGLPKNSLKEYPLIIIEPSNSINLGKLVIKLTSKFNGPLSGKSNLPTWDEQAELFARKLNSFLF